MPRFFGTPEQQRLQQRVHERLDWTNATPGACNPGRFLGTDDPERLGWDVVADILEHDGFFGFRLIRASDIPEIQAKLAELGFRIDFWDVFAAPAETVLGQCHPIINQPLPEGLNWRSDADLREPDKIEQVQTLISNCGVVPLYADMMCGKAVPSVLCVLEDHSGKAIAAAYGYMPHNEHSLHRNNAWGGLVAVDTEHRGQRLGVLVNAKMAAMCVEQLGAQHLHELVSSSNDTSRRMVQRCGLVLDPHLKCGIATKGETRFTR